MVSFVHTAEGFFIAAAFCGNIMPTERVLPAVKLAHLYGCHLMSCSFTARRGGGKRGKQRFRDDHECWFVTIMHAMSTFTDYVFLATDICPVTLISRL